MTSHGYGVVEAGDDFTAGATMKIYFTPQPDITAYELAVFVAHLGGGFLPRQGVNIPQDEWDRLGPSLQRHWSLTKPEESTS